MIKRIFAALLVIVVAVAVTSCDEQAKKCKELTEALKAQDFDKVEKVCGELYDKLPDCKVETLGDMTVSYIAIVANNAMHGNQAETADAMRRAIACYDEAEKRDHDAATKMWIEMASQRNAQGVSINPIDIIDAFRAQLALYDATSSTQPEATDSAQVSAEEGEEIATAVSED